MESAGCGRTVGVIGGGAAGMAAAITAARRGAEVTLLERNDRLGKKLLSTGNGKCNLGNEKPDVGEYHTESPEILERCLRRFGAADTVSFFRGIGLMVKSRNGLLYPVCEQASAVLDALRYEVAALGVRVVTDCAVERVEAVHGGIRASGCGRTFSFDRVVLACGGRAAPRTGSDGSGYVLAGQLGHSVLPVVPALVQLRCREDMRPVAGVRADAELTVLSGGGHVAQERGELQLTDGYLSGIPVFQLSRVVNYILSEGERPGQGRPPGEVEVRIDFLPDLPQEAFEALCADRWRLLAGRTVEEFFTGILHKKLMMHFVRLAGLKPTERMDRADRGKVRRVYGLCRRWTVHVTGSNSYDGAQACAGGVPLWEVTESLESRKTGGVYLAGELLDVDGRCGGYNLHWAWCSGCLAGAGAASDGGG